MKSSFLIFSTGVTALSVSLALSACSPSRPASDATASVSETPAATLAATDTTEDTSDTTVTESVASSAATVVVTQAETYDPVVIKEMGQKPGYWEVKHTDPKTKKSYVTHVCVDKALGSRLTRQGPISAPADRRDYKDDADFKGACPTGIRGGDVQKDDGRKINAYGDHTPDKGHDKTDRNSHDDDHNNQSHASGNDQAHTSAEPSHNPHTTPAEDHARGAAGDDRPDTHRN